jgi:hypothetical protein
MCESKPATIQKMGNAQPNLRTDLPMGRLRDVGEDFQSRAQRVM